MYTEDSGVETLQDEYSVVVCLYTGAKNFECDINAPTLEQNGEVEICLTPTSTDTKIFHLSLNIKQENNTSRMLPIPLVTNDGNGVQYTYPLTVITKSGDTNKVTATVLGLFFDQFNTDGVTTLPPIKLNGTVDLNLHTVASTPDQCGSCYGGGRKGEFYNTCDDVKQVLNQEYPDFHLPFNIFLNPPPPCWVQRAVPYVKTKVVCLVNVVSLRMPLFFG